MCTFNEVLLLSYCFVWSGLCFLLFSSCFLQPLLISLSSLWRVVWRLLFWRGISLQAMKPLQALEVWGTRLPWKTWPLGGNTLLRPLREVSLSPWCTPLSTASQWGLRCQEDQGRTARGSAPQHQVRPHRHCVLRTLNCVLWTVYSLYCDLCVCALCSELSYVLHDSSSTNCHW